MKFLPHLNHLKSFEASARHLSFTAAADELNYTQSAVSNHIRSLEGFIGRPLFVRYPQSLTLTSLGEAYLPTVQHALHEVDVATESIMMRRHGRQVVLSCPVSLAENWLAPRLVAFSQIHPDIDVTIHGRIWKDEAPEVADIRLTYGRRADMPTSFTRLWADTLTILCRPGHDIDGKPVTRPEQLAGANLIHILGRPDYWQAVKQHFELDTLSLTGGTQTNSLNVAMELAAEGHGFAVVPRSVADTYLQRGLLAAPFPVDLDSPWACYISDESLLNSNEARSLHRFLFQEASSPPL